MSQTAIRHLAGAPAATAEKAIAVNIERIESTRRCFPESVTARGPLAPGQFRHDDICRLLCAADAANRKPVRTRSRLERSKPCAGPIYGGHVLTTRTQEERVPASAARHIQCRPARQQRQELLHNAHRL